MTTTTFDKRTKLNFRGPMQETDPKKIAFLQNLA
jgi:hypothetical protein